MAIRAQQTPSQEVRVSARSYIPVSPALRVESDLVEVTAVVRDRNGRTVAGLTREDFQVLDQGKPQEIIHFALETSGSLRPAAPGSTPRQAPAAAADVAGAAATPPTGSAATGVAASVTRSPRFIVLYFDTFSINKGHLKWTQAAARRFVTEGLLSNDRVAIFSSSSGRVLDFTTDKNKLSSAIDKLAAHPLISENGLNGCPRITPYQAYLIVERFDTEALGAAVDEARVCSNADDGMVAYTRNPALDPVTGMVKAQAEITWNQARAASQATLDGITGAAASLANVRGRRLLLLVSSGFLAGSLERERDRLIEQCLHAGIVINTMDAKGLYVETPSRPIDELLEEPAVPESTFHFEAVTQLSRIEAGSDIMVDFAESTGGLFFHNNNDLAFGFQELGAMPSVSYILGFRPTGVVLDGHFHALKVRLTSSKSYALEARPGYFADPREISGSQDRRAARDREVMADWNSEEFPIAVTSQSSEAQAASASIAVRVHVDISRLQFPIREERHAQHLEFVAALLDSNGNVVTAKEGTMDFALTDATYSRLSESGVNAGFTLEAPSGKYRLRVVVQDAVEGKLASSLQAVELP